jgi:hypothetical protein
MISQEARFSSGQASSSMDAYLTEQLQSLLKKCRIAAFFADFLRVERAWKPCQILS